MRIVAALGGNALLRRGEPLSEETQRRNVAAAARALALLADGNDLVVTHGNGPQVGLLALQGAAAGEAVSLDVLDAETEGQIGYLVEQELANCLPEVREVATLLTRVEVDPADPAFARPSKPIGPFYGEAEARHLTAERGWTVAPDGDRFRRVVASPAPLRIVEIAAVRLLVEAGIVVICAGGGGIPVARGTDGRLAGVEAVIDKDRASALLARDLGAEVLLLLTDVDAVQAGWGTPQAHAIRRATPAELGALAFEPGTMAPKVEAACDFAGAGGRAAIGRLEDAAAILEGRAGTQIAGGP